MRLIVLTYIGYGKRREENLEIEILYTIELEKRGRERVKFMYNI